MPKRPAVGARVKVRRLKYLSRAAGQSGVVVAHHSDGVAIVVRLDPQKPLRPYRVEHSRRFDTLEGLKFRRREGDWVLEPTDVVLANKGRTPKSTLRRRASTQKASER